MQKLVDIKWNAVQKACQAVGGQAALARFMTQHGSKVAPQSVQQWCAKGYVPTRNGHAKLVHELTAIPLNELNPSAY